MIMSEFPIQKIEKEDIRAPHLEAGESAIVFQRHEKYDRTWDADSAGSIFVEHAEPAYKRDVEFFKELLKQDGPGSGETMVLFISSDTQYAGKGYRSMETAQLAQDAATEVMTSMGINPKERIININPRFNTKGFEATGQSIRPDKKIREPQIFDTPEYLDHLRATYGGDSGPGAGLIPEAWAAHEMDAEKEVREKLGAEGVHDMVDRTKRSIEVVDRYAKVFHKLNPEKKLVVWMASHYDTLSPLVKEAEGMGFDEYLPVDYGAGVIIELGHGEATTIKSQEAQVALNLGKVAAGPKS
jgi:hypothetical protein